MTTEEAVIISLEEKLPFLKGKLTSPAEKRVFSEFLDRNQFNRAVKVLREETDFFRAHHVVGTDEGEDLGFHYLFSNTDHVILVLKEKVPKKNPEIDSVTPFYPAFLLHEMELQDLFGADIDGLPTKKHYPLPDNWPEGQYPMRKEWDPKKFNKDTMTYEEGGDSDE